MPSPVRTVLCALGATILLAGCAGAGASTGGNPPTARSGVEIGTALTCDRGTCEERAPDGSLVRVFPTPVDSDSTGETAVRR